MAPKKKDTLDAVRKDALAALEKDLDRSGLLLKPLSEIPTQPIERLSTGSVSLDAATGGGLPKGRIVEIFGSESGGKTSLVLKAIAECQKAGGLAALIDVEQTFDPVWAAKLGVDVPALFLNQPDSGEEALNVTVVAARSGAFSLIAVDSVAALVPRAELMGEMGDAHVGLQARLMGQACRRLAGICNKHGCTVVFINQLRMKIVQFGNPETTSGGRALPYYASLRLDVRRGDPIKSKDDTVGVYIKVKIPKNKTARPFRTALVPLLFADGFDTVGELVDLGADHGHIAKSGAWYYYNDEKLGQGREATINTLQTRPELVAALRTQVLTSLGL